MVRVVALALVLGFGAASCKEQGEPPRPSSASALGGPGTPRPGAALAPRPVQLPAGSCCCEAELRGDQVVRIIGDADCLKQLGGQCGPAERCWLADPPQISGK